MIAKGLEAGFFRYLTKPIKINEFMADAGCGAQICQNRVIWPKKLKKKCL